MTKRKAIIVDRDGTLARIDRSFLDCERPDWRSFHAAIPFDTPVPAIVNLTRSIADDIAVIICTGRQADFSPQMHAWLRKHGIRYDLLLMRKSGDYRPDNIIKSELFRDYIDPNFDVLYAVDDRPSVCDMWRALGIPLIQVTQPEELPVFGGLGL